MTGQRDDGTAARGRALTRRGLLGAIGAAAVGAAAPTATASQVGEPWPMFQADAGNTGAVAGSAAPRAEAGARWGFADGEEIETAPVASSDSVFVADGGAGVVRALSRRDGTERWQVDADVSETQLAVGDGTLYVPASSELLALDVADGSEQWTTSADGHAVTLEGDYVYVSGSTGVARVSRNSGQVSWETDRLNQISGAPAVVDDFLYVAGEQYGNVIARDPVSGGRRWSRLLGNLDPAIEGVARGPPTRADTRVVVPTDETLVAFEFNTGNLQWQYGAAVHSSVAVSDGVVYGTTTGEEAVAVSLDDGEEVWRASAPAGSHPPVVAGSLLYVTGTDGTVAALALADGSTVWETRVGGERSAGVAVAGGDLLVADREGQVAALAEGAGGALGGATPTEAPATDPPADDEPTATATPTGTGAPGFGLAAGAAAVGAGALAALRRGRED